MNLGYARGNRVTQQLNFLEDYPVDEIFSDGIIEYEELSHPDSEFQALMSYAQPGDQIVISSLEVISRDYQQLIAFINELEKNGLRLTVLSLPNLSMEEWRIFLSWSLKNERILHPRLLKIGSEKNRNRNSYSLFSKDTEAKKLYKEVIWLLFEKKSVKQIAKLKKIPLETVFRIKQELSRMVLAVGLVICFVLSIFSIKVAEMYFESIWIQIIISILMIGFILYNVLSDSEEI